jgi:hypothetical protein
MDVDEFLKSRGALKCPPAVARGSNPSRLTLARESRKTRKHRIHRQRKEPTDSYDGSDFEDLFFELRNQAPSVFL